MIEPGQICRDNTRKTFRIVIVLEPSSKDGKLRICRWQPTDEPAGGHWCAPCTQFEHHLEPITAAFDLTTRRGQVISAARRSVVGGLVRWQIGGPRFSAYVDPQLTEVHNVGKVRP